MEKHRQPGPVPPLVAALSGADDATFEAAVTSAIRVTSVNPVALDYGLAAARMMRAAGPSPDLSVVLAAARGASDEATARIAEAAARVDQSSDAVAAEFGMACYLSSGVPVVAHIIATAPSFTEAVRRNIHAGGDTCGRAMLLGAVMGAIHGVGGDRGMPDAWVSQLTADLT